MMKCSVISVLATSFIARATTASIIGDTVTVAHEFPTPNTYFDGPYSTTVVAGSADAVTITPFADLHPGYIVNVEADRILIDFIDSVSFTAGNPIHGVLVESIDDFANPAWVITSAVYAPGTATTGTLTFSDHTVRINWQGSFVSVGTHYEILLAGVPAPGTGAASMLFLLGAKGRRRRR